MDVNAGKSARLAVQYNKIKAERDDLKKRLELAQEMIEEEPALREKAQKGRDALAAQLDRLRVKIITDLVRSGIDPKDITASLTRRDALKRAEALEVEADLIEKASPGCGASKRVASVLRERAKYFRYQAGEDAP